MGTLAGEQLGYRSANFCFFFPPIRIWEVIKFDLAEHRFIEAARSARLVLRSDGMPKVSAELRVFINAPDANAGTPIDNNPNLAGTHEGGDDHVEPFVDSAKALASGGLGEAVVRHPPTRRRLPVPARATVPNSGPRPAPARR